MPKNQTAARAQSHHHFFAAQWWRFSFLLILVFALCLRLWKYWEFPVVGETQDEVAWSMLGSSLLQTGQPQSWSYFKSYTNKQTVQYGNTSMILVRPDLDHPPLFSLIPGAMQTLLHHAWQELPSSKVNRLPMVVIGVLNVGLLMIWLRRLKVSPWWIGVSGTIYATAPAFVFLSRLVVAENLLVTWILLWLITEAGAFKRSSWLRYLALIASPLTKIAGLALNGAAIAADISQRRWQQLRHDLVASGVSTGLLLLYAARFDFGLFWRVQSEQSQRDVGLLTFFTTQLWSSTLVERLFGDVWISLGWIAMVVFVLVTVMTMRRGNAADKTQAQESDMPAAQSVALLAIAQLAFILLSVGEHTVHGWYRIVFIPIFVYLFGWLADRLVRLRHWLGWSMILLLVVMPEVRLALMYLIGFTSAQWWPLILKLGGVLAVGGVGLAILPGNRWRQPKLFTGAMLGIIGLLVVCHMLTVLTIQPVRYWQDAFYLETGLRP